MPMMSRCTATAAARSAAAIARSVCGAGVHVTPDRRRAKNATHTEKRKHYNTRTCAGDTRFEAFRKNIFGCNTAQPNAAQQNSSRARNARRTRCRSRTWDAVRSSLNFFFRSSFRNRALVLLWWIVACAHAARARTPQAVCDAHWPARPTARPSQGSHRAVDTQTHGPGRSAQTQPAKSASARAGTGRR